MADKDFKVKNKLFVNGLSNASGVILATNNNLDSSTTLPTQYGGTGTTTSPNAGQIPYSSSGTNYAPTDLSSLTISSSGGSTITAASASTKGLIIKGAASQTANLQEWQNSSGNKLAKIISNGSLVFGNGNSGVDDITTIHFDEVTTSTNTPNGITWNFVTTNTKSAQILAVRTAASYATDLYFATANPASQVASEKMRISSTGTVSINGFTSSNVGLIVKGAASQTANLQEWQNSAGTVLASIASTGQINAGAGFYTDWAGVGTGRIGAAHLSVSSQYLGNIVSIFKGTSGQTANLTEWQNSSGTVLAKVDSAGSINAVGLSLTSTVSGTMFSVDPTYGVIKSRGGAVGFTGAASLNIGTNYTGQSAIVASGFAGQSVSTVIIKSVASQTSNLTEWQNSSGTVLASISAAGNLTVQDLTVNGTTTTINSTTLTVDDKNIELASVASPTDTTADGAGITIKGATDKTFNWVQSTGAFTSSEPISTPALSVSGNSVSSDITLAAGKRYFVDTTSARTLTLPASPTLADTIEIYDASGAAATNNITVNSNSGKINGTVQDLTVDTNGAAFSLVYTGSTYGWVVR